SYNKQGAIAEAGVNAATVPATRFATFGQINGRGSTGIAFANPSSQPATITIIGLGGSGSPLTSVVPPPIVLPPGAHAAISLDKMGLSPGNTSVQMQSTVPIVSLSLNFEAAPAFSSLPPADLPASTPIATATGP